MHKLGIFGNFLNMKLKIKYDEHIYSKENTNNTNNTNNNN